MAFLAAAWPMALLLDLIRPVVIEATLLHRIAEARGVHEAFFDLTDYAVLGSIALFLLLIAGLALAGRSGAMARIALATWSSAFVLLAFEALMCLADRPYVFPPGLKRTFHPDPEIMPGVSGPSSFSTNAIGMRGPEWDAKAYKILCVGGSTTICTYLDDTETWPHQLMQLLERQQAGQRFWVGNVGKSGHATYHHIELLRHLPEARRVDCVLVLCGVNDLEHSIRMPHAVRKRLAASRVFAMGGGFDPAEPYAKQTYVYRAAKGILSRTPLRNAMEVEDAEGRAYALRRKARRAASQDYPLPALDSDLVIYEENLARIADWCNTYDVRCVFMTQPTLWAENMAADLEALLASRRIGRTGRVLPAADLARGMKAFNDTMRRFCRKRGAECIDLAAVCPKDTRVFYDDEHFNETGARLVAATIAKYLSGTHVGRRAADGR